MDLIHVHFMSIVDKMLPIYIHSVERRGNFYFDEECFSLVKREVRNIPLLFLPITAIFSVSDDGVFALSGVEMEGDVIAASFAVFLKIDCKSGGKGRWMHIDYDCAVTSV